MIKASNQVSSKYRYLFVGIKIGNCYRVKFDHKKNSIVLEEMVFGLTIYLLEAYFQHIVTTSTIDRQEYYGKEGK